MRRHGYFYGQSSDYGKARLADRVLVALVPSARDLGIARDQHWYRVPIRSAPSPMAFRWLALYQMKGFEGESHAIRYFAPITALERRRRHELLPDEAGHPRAEEEYYQVRLGELQRLPAPIVSRRWRYIVFIATTLDRFRAAREINDLFYESPLEEAFWRRLRREHIEAERQWHVEVAKAHYFLDFAVFCANGQLDVECDGDTWHADRVRIPEDNARDNALATDGWAVLRFNTAQITDDLPACLWRVREAAAHYGGIVTAEGEHRWPATGAGETKQLSLFNGHADDGQ